MYDRRRQLVNLGVLTLLLLAQPGGALVAPAPALLGGPAAEGAPHPGLTAMDVQWIVERLAAGDGDVVSSLAPLTGDGARLEVPADVLAPVLDPPPLRVTLAALEDRHGRAGALAPASLDRLPADVARALSVLGQAALVAGPLARGGDAMVGSAIVERAVADAFPTLARHAIYLEYPRAYSDLASQEAATRSRLAALEDVRTPDDAFRALGIPDAPPVAADAPLSELLARLYAHLGVPVGFEERAALAAADALDPGVASPLRAALARVLEAATLRDAAYGALTPADWAALARVDAVLDAARAPSPTAEDLDALAAYGRAIERIDARRLLEGEAQLLAAARALDRVNAAPGGVPFPSVPVPGTGSADLQVGDLYVIGAHEGDARGVQLRIGDEPGAPERAYGSLEFSFDAWTGSVRFYEDHNGDGRAQQGEVVHETPPLAHPDEDVIFRDPHGFVLVTGDRTTTVDDRFGGRDVHVDVALLEAVSALPPRTETALRAFDRQLAAAPDGGAWPYARGSLAASLAGAADTAGSGDVQVTVNPGAYQVLHWDLGGNDVYHTNAAGAGDRGLLALGGDGPQRTIHPNVTRAPLPVSVLVDAGGDDAYATVDAHTLAAADAGLALLFDLRGNDALRFDGVGHGLASAARGGVSLLVTGDGAHRYEAGDRALAYAASGGTAALVDAGGPDRYAAGNASLAAANVSAAALLFDLAGDDVYAGHNFTQAASRGGLALLLDAAGNDAYETGVAETAQGFAEPYGPHPGVPCVHAAPCPRLVGPARLALLVDAAGADTGACTQEGFSNALVGRVGVERAFLAAGPYNPAAGACLDVGADPRPADAVRVHDDGGAPENASAEAAVPPTFFTSAFGNVTLPGVVRFSPLGDDVVPDPYVLSVDLTGDDAYGSGAVAAVAGATPETLAGLSAGYLNPVSLFLDFDGADTFDAGMPGAPALPGRFGYADGGLALQAAFTTRRAAADVDPDAGSRAVDAANVTEEDGARPREAGDAVATRYRWDTNRYLNVSVGLGAAERGGVALVVNEHVRSVYEGAPDFTEGASCRLACAKTGGVAVVLAKGGPGDVVNATPYSLGAVHANPLGGVAVYLHRDGRDVFEGSNRTMGVVAPATGPSLTSAAPRGPAVALFIKDGWARDAYGAGLQAPAGRGGPKGNDLRWEDAPTAQAFRVFDQPTFHVAQGYDNLDWFAHSRVADADRGVAADQGPSPNAAEAYPQAYGVLEAAYGGQPPLVPAPAFADRGETAPVYGAAYVGTGGSATGPDGLRPVTLARTPLAPVIRLEGIGDSGRQESPHEVDAIHRTRTLFRTMIRNPPAYADQTLVGSYDSRSDDANPVYRDGSAIQRVEFVVEGVHDRWQGCPVPGKADPTNPAACVMAVWDRDEDPWRGQIAANTIRRVATPTPGLGGDEWTRFDVYWSAGGSDGERPFFPPGEYVLSIRAFAARPYGLPLAPLGVGDWMLESLASDAINHTDDGYGMYGASYHLRLPVLQEPTFLEGTRPAIKDVGLDNGTVTPFRLEAKAPEPVRFRGTVYPAKADALRPTTAVPDLARPLVELPMDDSDGWIETPSWGNPGGPYADLGYEPVTLTWNGSAADGRTLAPGRYFLILEVEGELSGQVWDGTSHTGADPVFTFYVDFTPPETGVDVRPLPDTRITAEEAPDGRFTLLIPVEEATTENLDRTPAYPHAADVGVPVHLWYQELVLDAANPGRVIEASPWRHEAHERLGARFIQGTAYRTLEFQADPVPGAPRQYRFAAYVADRAGNLAVADPANATPDGPDCMQGACATFLYDIAPPRTRLDLAEPNAETTRIRNESVRLRIDASETPDVARVQVYAHVAENEDAPVSFANFTPVPDEQIEGKIVTWTPPNGTLADGSVIYLLSRGIDRVGNVEDKVDYDLKLTVDLSAPTLRSASLVAEGARNATLAWRTDEPAHGVVHVRDAAGVEVARVDTGPRLQSAHEVRLTGLDPDTRHHVTLQLRDAVGNVANRTTFDGAPLSVRTRPAVALDVDPLPAVVTAPVNVTWRATHAETRDVTYNLTLLTGHGTPVPLTPDGMRVHEDGAGSRTFRLDPARLPEAAHARVRVEAYPTGLPASSTSAETNAFTLDGQGPRIRVADGAGVTTYTNGTVHLDASATDGGSGVAQLAWSLDNATFQPMDGPLTFEDDVPARVWLRATDRAGHRAPVLEVPLRVDPLAPTVHVALPRGAHTAGAPVPIEIHATDDGAGVARIHVADDTGHNRSIAAAGLVDGRARLLWPVDDRPGAHNVTIRARDAAGNEAHATVRLTVDHEPPRGHIQATVTTAAAASFLLRANEPVTAHAVLHGPHGARILPGTDAAAMPLHALRIHELAPGTTYTLDVTLRDRAGHPHNVTTTFTTAPDVTPPSALHNAYATPRSDGSLALRWDPATDDVGVHHYEVWRDGAVIALADEPFHLDAATAPGRVHAYRVVAVDAAGHRGPAAVLEAEARTAPRLDDLSVTLLADGSVRFRVNVTDPDGDPPQVTVHVDGMPTPLTVAATHPGGTHTMTVRLHPGPLRLDQGPRGYHVEATDGAFTTRTPLKADARLPIGNPGATEAESLLAAARETAAPGVALVLAAVAAAGLAATRVRTPARRWRR